MTLLVTGGHGFVMSNLVRAWLARHPGERAVVLDRTEPDPGTLDFLGEAAGRITFLAADVCDRAAWHGEVLSLGVDRIVHGAALTPHAYVDAAGHRHDPERDAPDRILDVNLGGTVAVLDCARRLPACRRVLLVSTGSVYGDEGPDAPLPEDGYVAPVSLYGVSKVAAEMVTRRYGELFGFPVAAARLASVYGFMDRILPSRHVVCKPNAMTALALAGEALRLNSAAPVGDYISATDVAEALCLLVDAAATRHFAYNVASGTATTLADLAQAVAALVPGARWEVDALRPNLVGNPDKLRGQWGAYDGSRLRDEFGWTSRPLATGLADYIAWRRERAGRGLPQ